MPRRSATTRVVLYLDELVLWLAGHSSDLPFVGRESAEDGEAQGGAGRRPRHPHRQLHRAAARPLAVPRRAGRRARSATSCRATCSHHEGRFETIDLADSNLPGHRRPPRRAPEGRVAGAEARRRLRARRGAPRGRRRACSSAARATRPTSRRSTRSRPALVEALVALSDCLQRERTAIRILMELLVDHLPDLELGPRGAGGRRLRRARRERGSRSTTR